MDEIQAKINRCVIKMTPNKCKRCGKEARLAYFGLNYGHVECPECGIRTEDDQMDKAISSWNRWHGA